MGSTGFLATDLCIGAMPLERGRDQRTWSGNRPGYGSSVAQRTFAPQHQQKPQRPSAPRMRVR